MRIRVGIEWGLAVTVAGLVGCSGGGGNPDAGEVPDSRRFDAAAIDAALADAAVIDASPPDAVVIDASIPDAVVIDAPPPDAVVIDAPVDAAGSPDADLTPDASPPDAFVCSLDLAVTNDPGPTAQDLVLSEINPGQYIELYNNTAAALALGSSPYQLCSPFSYCALSSLAPGVTVPAHGYATVPWPVATGGCFASFFDGDSGGQVILYNSGIFSDDTAIVDFVCWGTNPHGSRQGQAFTAGKWSSASASSCAPALTGGALHRIIGTDGFDAADYDTTSPPNPMNCTP